MAPSDPQRAELIRLRERLEQIELSHTREIESLRDAIADLERRLTVEAETQQAPVPPPLPVPAEPEEVVPPIHEAPAIEEELPEDEDVAAIVAPPPVAPAKGEMELQIGRIWLVRIGVVLLVTGLVLLGNYAYQNWIKELPAAVRLVALYVSALGLSATGWWLAKRDRTEKFGEVLLAGGMAFFYWCTFASHQVERLRVIESPVLAALLLLGSAALIVGTSIRRKAPLTAMMGLLMSAYATTLQPVGWLAAVSNVFLAAGGVYLMRRPGWGALGWVGMVGIYASFLWWNLAGAAGGELHVSGMFFVAASWAMFALPGVIGMAGRFEGALSARGTAWFVGINNAACFGLISLQWLMLEFDSLWRVPAVFGLVLVALGALSRNRNAGSSTQLSQGLGLLTLALILRLEGYQMAVGLALESVALAVAFCRFRRLPELAFSMLAMVLSVLLAFIHPTTSTLSFGLVALLLTVTTGLWCWGKRNLKAETPIAILANVAAVSGLAAASAVAFLGWILRLDPIWQTGLTALISLGLSCGYLLAGGRRWLPALREASAAFAVVTVVLMPLHVLTVGSFSFSAVAICAACSAALWERRSGLPGVHPLTWLHALSFPLAMSFSIHEWDLGSQLSLILMSGAVPGMVLAFRWVRLRSLEVGASLMLLLSLLLMLDLGSNQAGYGFLTTASALLTLTAAAYRERPGWVGTKSVHGITRSTALVAWLWAWTGMFPQGWIDLIPLTTLAIWLTVRRLGFKQRLPEVGLLSFVSVVGFIGALATASWNQEAMPSIAHGFGFVASLGVATFLRVIPIALPREVRRLIQAAFAVGAAVWTTQALAVHLGWQPVAILWTLLGFTYVCVGLWRSMATLRHIGFALLTLALAKLFLVDVWAFETFIRVMAFIALGVALVTLGFFYNRFATVLKRLLADEEEADRPTVEEEGPTP